MLAVQGHYDLGVGPGAYPPMLKPFFTTGCWPRRRLRKSMSNRRRQRWARSAALAGNRRERGLHAAHSSRREGGASEKQPSEEGGKDYAYARNLGANVET